ncbi:MAG: hypothetical protein JJV97_00840 [SAR324 cluster bacterium]|nr:hypothetical protein [SAR324 cluster bacterium]
MPTDNIPSTVAKIRLEILNLISEPRLAQLQMLQPSLIGKLKNSKNASEKIASCFIKNINLSDPRFLQLSPKKSFPQNLNLSLNNLLTHINDRKYSTARQYLLDIEKKISPPEPNDFFWPDLKWRKLLFLQKLNKYFDNLVANHQLTQYSTNRVNFQFKYQKPLWKKTIATRASRLINVYCSVEIGLLPKRTFEIWWHNFNRQALHKDIEFYQELSAIMKDIYQKKPQNNRLAGVFISPDLVVNRAYQRWFKSTLPPPTVKWSNGYNFRKLASYNYLHDEIEISSIFDLPDIDLEMLDFLAYHELLHRQLGFRLTKHKTIAHSRHFRELEDGYPNADYFKKKLNKFVTARKF